MKTNTENKESINYATLSRPAFSVQNTKSFSGNNENNCDIVYTPSIDCVIQVFSTFTDTIYSLKEIMLLPEVTKIIRENNLQISTQDVISFKVYSSDNVTQHTVKQNAYQLNINVNKDYGSRFKEVVLEIDLTGNIIYKNTDFTDRKRKLHPDVKELISFWCYEPNQNFSLSQLLNIAELTLDADDVDVKVRTFSDSEKHYQIYLIK